MLAAGDAELAGQFLHADSAVLPVASRYLPAAHWSHTPLPTPALYLPASQTTQLPLAALVKPLWHRQSASWLLPAATVVLPVAHAEHAAADVAPGFPAKLAYLPTSQFAHVETTVAPTVAENLPATHAVHAAPLAP